MQLAKLFREIPEKGIMLGAFAVVVESDYFSVRVVAEGFENYEWLGGDLLRRLTPLECLARAGG